MDARSLTVKIVSSIALVALGTVVVAWVIPASLPRTWTLVIAALCTVAAGAALLAAMRSTSYALRLCVAVLCFAVPVAAASATAHDIGFVARTLTDESLRNELITPPTTDAAGNIVVEGHGEVTFDVELPVTEGMPTLAVFEWTDPIGIDRPAPSWGRDAESFTIVELDADGAVSDETDRSTTTAGDKRNALVTFAFPSGAHGLRILAVGGWRLTIPALDALPVASGAIRGTGTTIVRYEGSGTVVAGDPGLGYCSSWQIGQVDSGSDCTELMIGPEGAIIAIEGEAWSLEPVESER